MTSGVCNVTVVHDRRTLDISLPSHLPVGDVLPSLLHLLRLSGQAQQPGMWTLTPIGAAPIDYAATLTDADVTDGTVLTLTLAQQAPPPARLEHFLDVVSDHVDSGPGRWNRRATVEFVTAAGALLTLAALAGLSALHSGAPASLAAIIAAALALTTAAIGAAPRPAARSGAQPAIVGSALLLISGAIHAATAAAMAIPGPQLTTVPAAVALAIGGVGAMAARALRRTLAGPAALLTAFAAPLAAAGTLNDPRGPATVALLAVLCLGVLPRVVAGTGGLTALDYRLRNTGRVPADQVTAAVDRSAALLTWTLTGLAGAIATLSISCASTRQPWPVTLAALVGVATLIRARLFTRIRHILPPAIGGLVVLVTCALSVTAGLNPAAQETAVVGVALAGVVAAVVSTQGLRTATIARLRLAGGIVEATVIVAAVPALAAVLGLFDLVSSTLR